MLKFVTGRGKGEKKRAFSFLVPLIKLIFLSNLRRKQTKRANDNKLFLRNRCEIEFKVVRATLVMNQSGDRFWLSQILFVDGQLFARDKLNRTIRLDVKWVISLSDKNVHTTIRGYLPLAQLFSFLVVMMAWSFMAEINERKLFVCRYLLAKIKRARFFKPFFVLRLLLILTRIFLCGICRNGTGTPFFLFVCFISSSTKNKQSGK